ncbi:hypothetical protein [Actinosynnema pretiosum]|uniref:hypothetical protein n=1 Tax=Actinosynnema pretiosum TaxID=42197 RepID=UPI0012FD1DA1|nr:hypothetical protein [Actinosynnema pretiosum]
MAMATGGGLLTAGALATVVVVGAGMASSSEPADPWADLGLRQSAAAAPQTGRDCAAVMFGEVRQVAADRECRSITRTLLVVSDGRGTSAAVAVSWVEFGQRRDAREFRRVEDVHGTGDITPLPGAAAGIRDVAFSALHYTSALNASTVIVAEAEPLEGAPGDDLLREITGVAVLLDRPAG